MSDKSSMAICSTIRSSRPEVFCKKGVLRNFTKFTGKYQCQSVFFYKVARLRAAALLKKRPWHRCFPVNYVKFLRILFHIEHFWWPLLYNSWEIFIKWKISFKNLIPWINWRLCVLLEKSMLVFISYMRKHFHGYQRYPHS